MRKIVKLVHSLRFLDSYQFVSQSLENLARPLSQTDFKHLKDGFLGIPDDLIGKITRKCFFPYSYLDSFTEFQKILPEIGELRRNSLSGKIDISFADYRHALDVYREFSCYNLGDYHDIYLKTDVLSFADTLKSLELYVSVYANLILHIFIQLQI